MKSILCEVSVIFIELCVENPILMQKARLHYLEIARFRHVTFQFTSRRIHILHYCGHFGRCMEI